MTICLFVCLCLCPAESYGRVKTCCEQGMKYIPKSVTCQQFAVQTFRKHPLCRRVFRECCEFIQANLDEDPDQKLILGRNGQSALITSHTDRQEVYYATMPKSSIHRL